MLVQDPRTSTSWLVAWAMLALGPMAAYAQPLVHWAITDNPLAFLAWVPVVAALWAIDNLRRSRAYADDAELNTIMGGTLAVTVAFALIAGPHLWPYVFASDHVAFLLWPLWALALAWLWFGVGTTRVLIAPLTYLLLAWPPLLAFVVAHTQDPLVHLDTAVLSVLARVPVHWLSMASQVGIIQVAYGARTVPLSVGTACSGIDGVLAVAIILPFVLSRSVGGVWAKVALVGASCVASVGLNLVRMAMLVAALHLWGEGFALGVLHPALGPALFVVLAWLAVRWADRWGLLPLDAPAGDDAVVLPSPARTVAGLVLALALTAGLWPVLTAAAGVLGRPVPVRTFVPAALFPRMPGFRPVILGSYDDSSILGPGSASTAVAYSDRAGAYVLAQMWITPSAASLGSYSFDNCLLFHGDNLVATRPLALGRGTLGTLYDVVLPPGRQGGRGPVYLDMEWTQAVSLGGRTEYLRVALAVPQERAAAWRNQPTSAPAAPQAADSPWVLPAHGRIQEALRPMLRRLVGFGLRFEQTLDEESVRDV